MHVVLCVTNRQDINLHDITNSNGDDDIRSEESLKNSDDPIPLKPVSFMLAADWLDEEDDLQSYYWDRYESRGKSSEDSLDIVNIRFIIMRNNNDIAEHNCQQKWIFCSLLDYYRLHPRYPRKYVVYPFDDIQRQNISVLGFY